VSIKNKIKNQTMQLGEATKKEKVKGSREISDAYNIWIQKRRQGLEIRIHQERAVVI